MSRIHSEMSRPVAKCRLCFEIKQLCLSHLVPKAVYKTLKRGIKHAKQVTFGPKAVHASDRQLVDYLLCEACEKRFKTRGEDWITANCYRDPKTFKIQEVLRREQPIRDLADELIYAGRLIPALDMDAIIYFACSVFWRASVHTWSRPQTALPVHIDLGPYEEPLRLFLLDRGPFPDNMALLTRVAFWHMTGHVGQTANSFKAPFSERMAGVNAHHFSVPGVTFRLFVAKHISEVNREFSTAPAPQQYLWVVHRVDIEEANLIAAHYRAARAAKARAIKT